MLALLEHLCLRGKSEFWVVCYITTRVLLVGIFWCLETVDF